MKMMVLRVHDGIVGTSAGSHQAASMCSLSSTCGAMSHLVNCSVGCIRFPCSIFDIIMVDCHLVSHLAPLSKCVELCYLWIVGALNHLHPLMVLRLLFESVHSRLLSSPFESMKSSLRTSLPWSHSFIITSRHIRHLVIVYF